MIGNRQGGFATAAVLILSVVSVVAGAYLLKSAKHRSGAASDYFQARSAELAAQAGLQAGVASLEANPAEAVGLLNAYLADGSKAWLFNGPAGAGSRTSVGLGSNRQRYATRIAAFDPILGAIKLVAEGEGPGGGSSRAIGVFRLDGIAPAYPDLARFGLYVAGEARNIDQRVDITGDAYFGGDVHFNGGADGSVFRGAFKSAAGLGNASTSDALITFRENAYFETPLRSQGRNLVFQRGAGFASDLVLDADMRFTGVGQTAWMNGDVAGGNARMDMLGNAVRHSGSLNAARVVNASQIVNLHGAIPIAANLQMRAGNESELGVDLGAVPPSKLHTPGSLGIAAWGSTDGPELSAAYASARAGGRLHRDFLFIAVDNQLNFVPAAGNVLAGKFVFVVRGTLNVNGNLPDSDPGSVSLYHVLADGRMQGFGGTGLFRGYVNVTGNAGVIYSWGPGSLVQGALHHVSPDCGFQFNNPAGGVFTLQFDKGVFDALAPLGILAPAGGPAPNLPPQVKLVDTRIRPRFLGSFY